MQFRPNGFRLVGVSHSGLKSGIREDQLNRPVPDGFGNLAEYNLITFKSHRQALNEWALKEFGGHYVSYRKWVGPDKNNLILLRRELDKLRSRIERGAYRIR